jgi:hypothetical protein
MMPETNWIQNEDGEWVEAPPLMSKEDWLDIFADMDQDDFDRFEGIA